MLRTSAFRRQHTKPLYQRMTSAMPHTISIFNNPHSILIEGPLPQIAPAALHVALLRTPLHAHPGQVAKLDGPGNGVCGNKELVVENSSWIHVVSLFLGYSVAASSGVQRFLRFPLCNLLVLALHMVAQAQD